MTICGGRLVDNSFGLRENRILRLTDDPIIGFRMALVAGTKRLAWKNRLREIS